MTIVSFTTRDGSTHEVTANDGDSLMETAVRHGIEGIDAECGGACSCATCHVYVDEVWQQTLGEPEIMESDMLEFADSVGASSRLACQIKIRPELEGLKVRIPPAA